METKPQVQQSAKGFHQVQVIVNKEGKRIVLLTKDSKECSLSRAD